jgi:hypothetical protein
MNPQVQAYPEQFSQECINIANKCNDFIEQLTKHRAALG